MDMTWTIIGTGVAVSALNVALFAGLRADLAGQGRSIAALRERMAKLEGLLEGLREAVTGRQAA